MTITVLKKVSQALYLVSHMDTGELSNYELQPEPFHKCPTESEHRHPCSKRRSYFTTLASLSWPLADQKVKLVSSALRVKDQSRMG
jgi:hypothetical protein